MKNRKSLVIGICGGSGSGKTTIATRLCERFGLDETVMISQDSYYKSLDHLEEKQRQRVNFDHPDALDWRLFEQHLVALRNYKPVHAPVYDFVLHTRTASESIPAAKIILVDGHLILSIEKIRTLIDYSVYLDTGPDIMFIRRMMRDIKERGRTVNSVVDQYLISVREMYFEFTFPSMQYADSVVSGEKDLESIISLVAEDIERKFGIINVRF